ncbi:hypothetical protein [Aquibium sp. ELW1220]|uniref:hypothetical protein n=1 Tax=Aquibium sp. ELW1220 TaxID=2976766 RepID=UPI0025AED881|nr:hypothetical protein [Aquibium sp. ELW1220]MDN2583768.1 hypothetical protein [Aquibium sp. ELW1220]
MTEAGAQKEFALSLLTEVAPDEAEFVDAYEAAIDTAPANRRVGTGFGLPPELAGALGVAAVLVGRVIFDKLLEWSGEVAKKFVVDTAADRLKRWIGAPAKESLDGVLTSAGRLEILSIVDRDAERVGISAEGKERLRRAVIKQLGLGA